MGDTVFGHASSLHTWLEAQDQAYLLAVPTQHEIFRIGRVAYKVQEVYATLAESDWRRLSAGSGRQGEHG